MDRQLPLDPEPWYVVEADPDEDPDGGRGRYTDAAYQESGDQGEYGGNVYNLAVWKPRRGYEQEKEKYRRVKLPGKTVAESLGIEVDPKAPGGQRLYPPTGSGAQRSTRGRAVGVEREYEGYADA